MKIKYSWKTFKELSTDDLYAILNLRQKVFVMEQDCPYIDADYSDQEAFHLLGYDEKNTLKAYLRAFSPNIKYKGASMGRIVVEEGMRNKSIGKEITNIGIRFLSEKYPNHEIIISAQHRLQKFYEGLGFVARGEVYLEDDIDHIQMYMLSK
jgi:ElaA protein